MAGAPVIADISALQEGQRLILEWRGQPIWIVKRSKARSWTRWRRWTAVCATRNPRWRTSSRPNVLKGNPEYRSIKPEISVLVGLCTHLGCSPEMAAEIRPEPFDPNWKAAISAPATSRVSTCPAVYSMAFPAPTNLVVPIHYYENDTTIVIGVNPQGAA